MSRKIIFGMHFAVYTHKLVVGENRLITRNFIVLKNEYNIITQFTDFHHYIHSSRRRGAHSISDDGNNRFSFVAHFLNYIFFTNNQEHKYRSLTDIDADIVQQFFYEYGSVQSDGTARTKSTVTQCTNAVIDFLTCFVKEYRGRCNYWCFKKFTFLEMNQNDIILAKFFFGFYKHMFARIYSRKHTLANSYICYITDITYPHIVK